MKLMAQKWIAAGLLACVGSVASATTLNFDELTGTRYFSTAPSENPYNGFNFACSTNCDTGSWFHSNDNSLKNWYKSPFTSVSTTYGEDDEGFPIYGESLPITSVIGPVIFNGAYFTSGSGDVNDPTDPPIDIEFVLYYLGAYVHTSAMLTLYWDPWTRSGCRPTRAISRWTISSSSASPSRKPWRWPWPHWLAWAQRLAAVAARMPLPERTDTHRAETTGPCGASCRAILFARRRAPAACPDAQ